MKSTIWIIEDERGAQLLYQRELENKFKIRALYTIAEFESALSSINDDELPELLIVDLSLPDGDMLEFISSSARFKELNIPTLIVTANDKEDAISGAFNYGTLDYLVKPFNMNALSFKVRRFIEENRKKKQENDFLSLNPKIHSVSNKHGEVFLTKKEYQILTLLLNGENRSITKETMLEQVWKNTTVLDNNVMVNISRLRKKLSGLYITIFYKAPNIFQLAGQDEKLSKVV